MIYHYCLILKGVEFGIPIFTLFQVKFFFVFSELKRRLKAEQKAKEKAEKQAAATAAAQQVSKIFYL